MTAIFHCPQNSTLSLSWSCCKIPAMHHYCTTALRRSVTNSVLSSADLQVRSMHPGVNLCMSTCAGMLSVWKCPWSFFISQISSCVSVCARMCLLRRACVCTQECENVSSRRSPSQYLFLHSLPLIFDYHAAVSPNPPTVEWFSVIIFLLCPVRMLGKLAPGTVNYLIMEIRKWSGRELAMINAKSEKTFFLSLSHWNSVLDHASCI